MKINIAVSITIKNTVITVSFMDNQVDAQINGHSQHFMPMFFFVFSRTGPVILVSIMAHVQ